jgi:phospholipase C
MDMADLTKDIDTIVIVLMENRSFDHMLGYLGLPPISLNIEGLQKTGGPRYGNPYNGNSYLPFHMSRLDLPHDPPHERPWIANQIGAVINGQYNMTGFVESYYMNGQIAGPDPGTLPEVMGYFGPTEVPLTDFLARNFAVCDHWFSSVPASTQPNRLMAMSGYTLIDGNVHVLDDQYLLYDWLNDHGVSWRVYHEGIPFFALMPRMIPRLLDDNFRGLDRLYTDVKDESEATFPEVIFIEPTYTDAPHIGDPSDDHPPSSIAGGQTFLRKVYMALTSNPARWGRTVAILTYDEHGGFFDHVSPMPIVTPPSRNASYPQFDSSGVRVPGIIISPLVPQATIYTKPLDHTSILSFVAQRFGKGETYSAEVEARRKVFTGNIFEMLSLNSPRTKIDLPPGALTGEDANAVAFKKAAAGMTDLDPDQMTNKFPELRGFVKGS